VGETPVVADFLENLRGHGELSGCLVEAQQGGMQRAEDLDEVGLVACSVHGKLLDPSAEEVLRGTQIVGADTVIVPKAPQVRFADAGTITELASDLNEAAARAADYGLRVGYHNEAFEIASLVGGRPALDVLADALDERVILEVDTYWVAVGGQDVPAVLNRLGDRVRYLHVKDGPVTESPVQTALGSGRMPVADILASCPSAEWHVVEFDECATDVVTALDESLMWLVDQGLARRADTVAGAR
jgi:sugar phosphate isomerase/epimerase